MVPVHLHFFSAQLASVLLPSVWFQDRDVLRCCLWKSPPLVTTAFLLPASQDRPEDHSHLHVVLLAPLFLFLLSRRSFEPIRHRRPAMRFEWGGLTALLLLLAHEVQLPRGHAQLWPQIFQFFLCLPEFD